jgi:hypothetical protein
MFIAEDIDGQTLNGLTKAIVAHLYPTMKKQVLLLDANANLKQQR